ncbi:MAG: hypothetical protein A3F72_15705 [Bacteroidetes bacterium RIFCSPLOWO2_12_FULL_35_15]|nr:MAG: hypothetical protein A3F72_15705 [Bacteroidetes bacterium RIFCSPLOWO2_12_FULL_35_15]
MVRGLDKFKEYFNDYPDNYVIIGGTACDIIIDEAGFTPRATKDIDIILVVEALSAEFVRQFWKFIKDGNYERKEKSDDDRRYYRFTKPENKEFPYQIELFSRLPDVIEPDESIHITPIPVDDDLSSLSAILLSDEYYNYMIEHSTLENGLHRANTEALICLKAKAFLEMTERKARGEQEDEKHIRKHKADVFRLAVLLAEEDNFELPPGIKAHMQAFANAIANDLPDKAVFKEMGLGTVNVEELFIRLLKSFDIKV